MALSPPLRQARRLALIVPVALLGGALLFQYVGGLFPCEMCWWQRYPHMAAIVLAALSFAVARPRPLVALAAIAIAVSGLIGGFHAGVEYGWWQGFTACTSTAASGGNALDNIMNAPIIRCDVAQWRLVGVSLAGWNFIISLAAALAIFALLAVRKGHGRETLA